MGSKQRLPITVHNNSIISGDYAHDDEDEVSATAADDALVDAAAMEPAIPPEAPLVNVGAAAQLDTVDFGPYQHGPGK